MKLRVEINFQTLGLFFFFTPNCHSGRKKKFFMSLERDPVIQKSPQLFGGGWDIVSGTWLCLAALLRTNILVLCLDSIPFPLLCYDTTQKKADSPSQRVYVTHIKIKITSKKWYCE